MNRIEVSFTDDGSQEVQFAEEVAPHDQQGDKERERQEDVGHPHQDVIEASAAQTSDGAHSDADERRHDRHADPDDQRDTEPVDETAVRWRRCRRYRTSPTDDWRRGRVGLPRSAVKMASFTP